MSSTTASQEEMKAARLPLGWRDQCSALLIPLNKCRHRELYMPWKCEDERHGYEKCQYDECFPFLAFPSLSTRPNSTISFHLINSTTSAVNEQLHSTDKAITKAKEGSSGGITGRTIGVEYGALCKDQKACRGIPAEYGGVQSIGKLYA